MARMVNDSWSMRIVGGVGSVSIVREGTLDLQKVMHSLLWQNEEAVEKIPQGFLNGWLKIFADKYVVRDIAVHER